MSAEYWREALLTAFENEGLWDLVKDIPSRKLDSLGEALSISNECMSMAFYAPPNPLERENKELKEALNKERNMVFCKYCEGHGRVTTLGPYHSSNSSCHKCDGKGKI